MPIRNSYLAGLFYNFLEKSVLPKLTKTFRHPNHLTLMGLLIAAMAPFGFYLHPLFGFLFLLLSGISDSLDGLLARSQGTASKFGAFLDSSIDRCSDFCFLFGFWVLFWDSEKIIWASGLVFSTMFLSNFISYLKARALSIGVSCENGFMERGLRTVYLIIWAVLLGLFPGVFDQILWHGLILYGLLCLLTVLQRLFFIASRLA